MSPDVAATIALFDQIGLAHAYATLWLQTREQRPIARDRLLGLA